MSLSSASFIEIEEAHQIFLRTHKQKAYVFEQHDFFSLKRDSSEIKLADSYSKINVSSSESNWKSVRDISAKDMETAIFQRLFSKPKIKATTLVMP